MKGHRKLEQEDVWLVKHLLLPLTIKKAPPKANIKFMLQKYYNIVAKICQQNLHKKWPGLENEIFSSKTYFTMRIFKKIKKPEHNEMNFNVQVLTLKNKILLLESAAQIIIFA